MGGTLQPDNFYRIQSFTGNPKDRKLVRLATFLKYIHKIEDVRSVSSYRTKFDQREIKLKENSFIIKSDRKEVDSAEEKRKIYRHRKKTSQMDALAEKDGNQEENQDENQDTGNNHEQTNTNLVFRNA